ncbi:hypothetical protein ASPSYDRAFT_79103 [Aspergillus sydowii CBS 593.65]|uniref:Alcohol dehydrogenase-like C-terminal domain-containing protein n=1 Tax=Aspergillus sydowii CBS 593.65 TaxID=1036612 RepID=A0A1L9TIN7_9EURO|nr:uncharacterized protein ASPSYDRAFT_79103 [Aspergillus sydowii CBS 593.65]OJJ59285.1 hypothetical protein ASPSYDRAFT_79103 [Aspergillus sydowii CBS 593.65]
MPLNWQAVVSYPPAHNGPWNAKLEEVSIRDIKPDECLVEIVASAGYLRKIGSDVPRSPMNLNEGDPVLLSIAFCGACPSCQAGHPSYCYDAYGLNFAHPGCDSYQVIAAPGQDTASPVVGGLGSLAVVSASCIVSLAGIAKSREELQLFAPLGCGFQTGAGTLSNLGKAQPDDSVTILGLGGVGLSAVMRKIIGCRRIIAVDCIPDGLSLATELDATHVIHTGELTTSLTDAVQLATEGLGSSLTLDTTEVLSIIRESLEMTSVLGRMDPLKIDMTKFKLAGKTLLGSVQGDVIPSKYILQLLGWYRAGKLPIEKLVRFYKPEDHATAVQDMTAGHTVKPIVELIMKDDFSAC